MESMDYKCKMLIAEAQRITESARELDKMRFLRDEIKQTSAECPTVCIRIESLCNSDIVVGMALGSCGEARTYHDDPVVSPTGLTGEILKYLEDRIKDDEDNLAKCIEYYKQDLDEVVRDEKYNVD